MLGSNQELKKNYLIIYYTRPDIGIMVRVSPMAREAWVQSQVETLKMVLDASLLNTQHYKVQIKGKVEKSRESSSALPNTLV